jgi:plastocyanin
MRIITLCVFAGLASLALGCSDTSSGPSIGGNVSILDECDPPSFNTSLGAGACTRAGSITLTQFNAELAAMQKVAEWQFVPASFTIHVGDAISVKNNGGETHTFTEVEKFGGGTVQALNDASGNPVETAECGQLKSTDRIAAGGTFRTEPALTVGTEMYQCCIHPWMRAMVTVTQ